MKSLHFLSTLKTFLVSTFVLISISDATAQTYPFTLPTTVSATLDVTTTNPEKANNKLLGFNYSRFQSEQDKELARKFNPVSVRWSEGNFYNWQTDGFNDDSYDNTTYQPILDQTISSNSKMGYNAMLSMNKELKLRNGSQYGFDMLFNFSVGFTSAASNVQRLKKYVSDGLHLTDIEIGNEYFWLFFRNLTTAEPTDQARLFKELADSLHKVNPALKISIPLGWRTNNASFNTTVMGDKKYYDAIAIHKYVGADPDIPGESDVAYSSLLTSRLALIKDVDYVRNQAPGKPVWLTEWNVDGAASGEWAAALGATDIYLYMYRNQNIYHRSCWFSAAGAKNPLVLMDPASIRTPKYPFEKTISGAMFEIVRSIFENSDLYSSTITTSKLTTSMGSIDAVNARMVIQDGKKKVLAVNLTNKAVDFVLKVDGSTYTENFTHQAMANNRMDTTYTLPIDMSPLKLIKQGTGQITLPPLSINVISLGPDLTNELPTIKIDAPLFNKTYKLGDEIPVKATATDNGTIKKVEFKIDDVLFGESTTAPYQIVFKPTKVGLYKISARAYDNDDYQKEAFVYVNVIVQFPFKGTPITIPGTIESEDYDLGGEGISYHDGAIGNDGAFYRPDNVDIGTTPDGGFCMANTYPGEWREYTINVLESGMYDFEFNYASKLTTGVIGAELFDEGIMLFNNLAFTQTSAANWTTYETKTKSVVELVAGEHILRINVVARGFNLDKLVIKKSVNSAVNNPNFSSDELKVYANPNTKGVFQLSKSGNWKVYNLAGETVLTGNENTVNLSKSPQGMYILKLGIETKKLIAQ